MMGSELEGVVGSDEESRRRHVGCWQEKLKFDQNVAAVEARVYSIGRCCQSTCSVSNETLIKYSNNNK